MLPRTLALVDDDREYAELLAQSLRDRGVAVDVFPDSNDLLTHAEPYGYDFYFVDLIKLLRRRTEVGMLVVSGLLAPDVFERVMTAGADMYLAKPVQFEQVALAIKAVHRRSAAANAAEATPWKLDRRARQLVAPDGTRVDLSAADLVVMECLVEASGVPVTRETFQRRLGRDREAGAADGLNAIMFRLRRRIERATPAVLPLQSKSGVGYTFRATLVTV